MPAGAVFLCSYLVKKDIGYKCLFFFLGRNIELLLFFYD